MEVSGNYVTLLCYLAVGLSALACYCSNTHCQLLHDDVFAIKTNADVYGNTDITDVFLHDFWGRPMNDNRSHKSYRPLCTLTFRLNYILHEFEPRGYHLTNNCLHIIACCLFFNICGSIVFREQKLAAAATLLFAAHPVHVEAVTGIVGRADVLACICFQIAFITYHRSAIETWKDDGRSRWCVFGVSMLWAAVALLVKEHGITVLGVCLLYDCCYVSRLQISRFYHNKPLTSEGRAFLHRIIFTTITIILLLYWRLSMNFGQEAFISKQDNPASFAPCLLTRILTYIHIYAVNAWLLVCPVRLSYDWQMGTLPLVETFTDGRNVTSLLFLVTMLLLIKKLLHTFVREKSRSPSLLIGLLFLVIPFLPASNIPIRVGFVVAERFLYIPSQGYAVIVATGFGCLLRTCHKMRKIMWTIAICLLLLLSWRTTVRNNVWTNRYTLYKSGIQDAPDNAKMHYNYANLMRELQRSEEAVQHYNIALKLWPEHASSYNNLASVVDNSSLSYTLYHEALVHNPSHSAAHFNLAVLRHQEGQGTEAVRYLKRAIQWDPYNTDYMAYLARVLQDNGDYTGAEDAYRTVIRLLPHSADAYNNLAVFLNKHNKTIEAKQMYEDALRLEPQHSAALINLARLLRTEGHTHQAGLLFERALSASRDAETLNAVGIHYYKIGRTSDALQLFREAMNITSDPQTVVHYAQALAATGNAVQAQRILESLVLHHSGHVEALYQLANILALQHRHSQAIEYLERAIYHSSETNELSQLYEKMANNYKDMQQFIRAKECYVKAVELNGNLGEAHLNLGVLFHLQGEYRDARKHYMRAQALMPNHNLVRENLRKLAIAEHS